MNKLNIAFKQKGVFSLFLAVLLFSSFGLSASGLKGKYTIDKTKAASSSNYTSFNDADSDLIYGARASGGSANGPGITGAVVFNVSDGLYLESLEIPYISGTSASNTITFNGHSGDSSKVVLQATTGGSYSSPGYVLHLNNTSFIRFNEITMQMVFSSSSSYSYYDHVVIVDNVSDSNTIKNCQLLGPWVSGKTYYGSCIYSGYNYTTYNYSQDQWDSFSNNYMKNSYYGVYWLGKFASGGAESGNVFDHNILDSNQYYGMMTYLQDSILITNNKIYMPYGNYGIYCYYYGYSYYGGNYHNLIANNFIALNNSSASASTDAGMMMYYNDRTDIVYNSINISGAASNSYGAYIYHWSKVAVNVYNNIFSNQNTTSSSYALYGNNWNDENYNDLDCGGNLMNYSGSNYTSLSAWTSSGLGFGANDVSATPLFVSATDLHVNNPALNAAATPYSGITTDIDGDVRNTSTPDIGADEFTPPALFPAIAGIVGPNSGFCAGTQDVYVRFYNFGTTTITSANIEWSVNGTAQTTFAWTGSLASAGYVDVKVGSYAFSSTTATYAVSSYVSSANGTSVTATAKSTGNRTIRAGLNSGTYLIDNSGAGTPDYTSIRAAVNDLNLKGLCGAVIFNIANGIYNESVQINNIPNSSASNTVIFQSKARSSSNVIIDTTWGGSWSAPGHVIAMNGSTYVTWRDITAVNSTSSSYSDVVDIYGGASNITLDKNVLTGNTASYTYGYVINDYYGSVENYITITNNQISGNYYGIQVSGSYGYPTASSERGIVIYNNTIDSGFGYGIMAEYVDSATISRNVIAYTNSTTWGYNGLYVYNYGVSSTDTLKIVNNFIAMSSQYAYGMMIYYANLANIYYNTVVTQSNSSYYYAGYIYNWTSGSTGNVVDNIFANLNGGPAISGNTNGMTNSNYNDFYTTGSTLGNWGGTSCSALSDWQSASSMDANSVSGDPMVNNFSTGDLHLTSKSKAVAHTGTTIPGYRTDIDSQSRTAYPCMGADETKLCTIDASTDIIDSPAVGFCSGTKNVYLQFRNMGTSTLTSCTLSWTVNGTAQTPVTWTGSLAFGATTNVKLGSVTFASGATKTIIASTNNANGAGVDCNPNNDTVSRSVGAGLTGTFSIDNTGASANYTSFRAAVTSLNTNGVCGAVVFNVAASNYNESVYLNAIPGSSATDTVTFQSKSGVNTDVILDTAWGGSWSGHGSVITMNGASNVRFRNMTITNVASMYNYSDAIILQNAASNNIFQGNVISVNTATYGTWGYAINDVYGSLEQYNKFLYNQINGGEYVVYLAGSGTGSTGVEFGNEFVGNTIDSGSYMGIYTNYQDSMTIANNTITLANYCYYGIYLYGAMATGSGNDSSFIMNNFITTSYSYGYGVYAYNCQLLNLYNNSMNCSSNNYCTYLYNYMSSYIMNFVNNIVVNDAGGACIYHQNVSWSDYNDYYTSGSTLGYWNGTSCAALTDLQTANSMDASSASADPIYNSPSTGDLHLTATSPAVVLHKGLSLTSVTNDIDGQARGKKPNMGADETPLSADDIGVKMITSPATGTCGSSNTIIGVKIANYSTNDESSYSVVVNAVKGASTSSVTVSMTKTLRGSGSFAPHDTTIYVSFSPALNTSAGGTYNITAYTVLSTDGDHSNDTATQSITFSTTAAKFSLAKTSICVGDTFKAKDASTVTGFAGTTTYKYYLIDNTGKKVDSSTAANPMFSPAAGNYRIFESVMAGCTDTTSMACTVNANPVASFTYNKACANDTTTFTNASTAGSGSISSYNWSFGNKSTSTATNPNTYYANGNYAVTVTLTVTNSNGCTNTATKSFSIDTLNASFTRKVAKDGTTSFSANDNTLNTYSWDFGDTSSLGSGTTPTHQFMKNNIYKTTLTVMNTAGCKNSWSTLDTVIITGIATVYNAEFSFGIYPNPVKENSTIFYTLDKAANVNLEVYDALGRRMGTLVNHYQTSGQYSLSFIPSEYNMSAAGIYFIKMTVGNQLLTKQIILSK